MTEEEPPKRIGRYRILLSEERDVEYWTNRLKVSREELEQAVRKVGPGAEAVSHLLNVSTPELAPPEQFRPSKFWFDRLRRKE